MTPAKNLQLYPEAPTPAPKQPQGQQRARRKPGTYGIIDNPILAYQKTHGAADTRILMALAEAHNYSRELSTAQLMIETGLGESAVRKALPKLAALGFCQQGKSGWQLASPDGEPDAQPDGEPDGCPKQGQEKPVLDGVSEAPKEVVRKLEDLKEQQQQFQIPSAQPAQVPPTAVALEIPLQKNEPETEQPELPTPDGAASGEANSGDKPSPSQEKTVSGKGEIVNVTDSETVPPAAPQTYREATDVLIGENWAVWRDWVRAHRPPRAAQDAQIVQFAGWVTAGLSAELTQHAGEITAAGSYAHPWPALVARMAKAANAKQAAQRTSAEVGRVFGEAKCQPGQRRRDPQTGQAWTVEEVAYGNVIFEEGSAPQDRPDAVVSGWEVLA